ncbi:acyl transferase domain-containing protein/NADPH:quinone reductase-like Zn-dependent oxidoreductase/acyl carrier protein [Sphingomonas vulcanisoli]|uniref:Acyl transferase domain-containing protein/NADPH:quinone reductase-like Zn-dependent oxidoreductase/acyl carrier protein n=1 Tax=Sphingomonas vulcanisoli TaxID=1658060 RepID=A0ABX0TV70_9SPHN|nr:acyl transferase domain-containing protein/NADPH:quinone reductase-like Zn-dependent oxidoreductase/acyl carrier protein [Sphingomonas vulcanisoli]
MNQSHHKFRGSAGGEYEPIAIIGAACRLPGAPDLESFWRLLLDGVDAVTEIPDARWNKAQLYHPERGQKGKSYTFAAGIIDDVKSFDAGFFGMSPREAVQTDPQQRLALELAYEALEDAGLDAASLAGEKVGVFVGGSSWDYLNLHVGDPSVIDAYSMIGATLCSLANRVSYIFDFRGPSFTVDTACSSSVVALHQACEGIRAGQMPMAMVGGISLLLSPQSFVGFSAASMLSPRGRCHAFDARADGYVRAEGGGFIVLKPLGQALTDGDSIRAVIRGTGVNSDGHTTGLSLPNKEAQIALLEEVYDRFGLDPADLCYLEAHGTGTPAGDPIETGALGAALGQRREAKLLIGSVKTNVGHLEAASGMAGLMKALLVAQGGVIPASLHLQNHNPDIPFNALNLEVVRTMRAVAPGSGPLIGLNSFGFGGTNAHAVLESPPSPLYPADREYTGKLPPLLLSARSDAALRTLAAQWQAIVEHEQDDLAGRIRSAALRRQQFERRLTIPASDAAALSNTLGTFVVEGRDALAITDTAVTGKTAFIFSGNGGQWAGMAQDALTLSPSFAEALAEVEAVLTPELGWSVTQALLEPDAEQLRNTAVAQPLLFATQVAMVMALRAQGVAADYCMGHSVGEVAAAWASGALDLQSATRVIAARSRNQQTQHGSGRMAVLGLGAKQAAAVLTQPPLNNALLAVAAHNSAQGVTVAGSAEAVDLLETEAKEHGWRFTRLDLDYAFHSPLMDPIASQLAQDLEGLEPQDGKGFVSTVTGDALNGAKLDAQYWWRNIREPVLFAEAAEKLVANGVRIFIEVGPHPVVRSYLAEALRGADADGRVVPTLQRRPAPSDPIKLIAARWHAAGGDIRGSADFAGPTSPLGLPRYPWQREVFWLPRTTEASDYFIRPYDHPLLGLRSHEGSDEWLQHIGLALQPWLADHVVGGTAVVPAAALIDMGLAATRVKFPGASALEMFDVEIGRALVLEPGVIRETMLRIGSPQGDFEIRSRPRLSDDGWTVHVKGRIAAGESTMPARPFDVPQAPIGRFASKTLYDLASAMGLDYGPAFRGVTDIDLFGDDQATAHLQSPGLISSGFLLPPDLLDGALQGLLSLAAERLGSGSGVMPWRFGRIRLLNPEGGTPALARLRLTRIGPRSVRADVLLLDVSDTPIAELSDCWFVRVTLAGGTSPDDLFFYPAKALTASATDAVIVISSEDLLGPKDLDAKPSEAALLADGFAAIAALEALRTTTDDRTVEPRNTKAAARPLVETLLGWLQADGMAEGNRLSDEDLPSASAILQTILAEQPAAIAEVTLLAQAAAELPALLRQGPEARGTRAAALLDQLRYDAPSARAASDALLAALDRLLDAWPQERPLRILELDAARGAFTRRLLRALDGRAFSIAALTNADDQPVLEAMLANEPGTSAIVARDLAEAGLFDLVIGLLPEAPPAVAEALPQSLAQGAMLLLAEACPSRFSFLVKPDVGGAPTDPLLSAFSHPLRHAQHIGLLPMEIVAATAKGTPIAAAATITRIQLVGNSPDIAAALEATGIAILHSTRQEFDASPLDPETPVLIALDSLGLSLPEQLALVARLPERLEDDMFADVTLVVSAGVEAAAIMGVRRAMANEAPNLHCRLIEIAGKISPERLAAELLRSDAEQEIALSASCRAVARVRRGLPRRQRRSRETLRLAISRPGLLDSLEWGEATPREPGAGELAIRVEASGLNFRDVMWAMGLLPDEALLDGFAGATLGLECAGVVTAVGKDVAGFTPGDRVMAFAPASLSTHTVTAAHAVMRIPRGMEFAAAATVPVAFLTVAYAVGHLGRLSRDETILIHGGAGGVGLAAIQYANHRGARVFATAGSPAKRALLESLGVDAVLDSRSLAFADEVMQLTEGEGVDIVLNSLAGEAMQRSLALVKPFGRFLELGKRDFYENTPIGLRPFRHNVTYFGIDADQLPLKRPALAAELFAEISGLMGAGVLRPLPYRQFDYADVGDAFRLMQVSGHIGKIVLAPGKALPANQSAAPDLKLASDGAYIVIGGLNGFGLEAARWLAGRGGGQLALLGRRGQSTPGAAEAIEELKALGAEARAYAVDVADETALADALDAIRAAQGAIRGVVHAAVAMDDALLAQLDADRFASALAPKLQGAEALDRLTRADPIDLFLLFSSVTTPIGNPGQGNYVAANAAIEALAVRRHTEGLPALAVQWGPISDAGYLARETGVRDLLSRQLGSAHLTAKQALDALPTLLASGLPVAGYATVRWATIARSLPLLASPLFADMKFAAGGEATEVDLRELLAHCTPDEARQRTTAMLIDEVARIMKLAPDRIDVQRPLTELGMDSLMAVELRLAVEQRFGVTVPVLALSEGATLSAMAGRILRSLGSEEDAPFSATDQMIERLAKHEGVTLSKSSSLDGAGDSQNAPDQRAFAAAAAASP